MTHSKFVETRPRDKKILWKQSKICRLSYEMDLIVLFRIIFRRTCTITWLKTILPFLVFYCFFFCLFRLFVFFSSLLVLKLNGLYWWQPWNRPSATIKGIQELLDYTNFTSVYLQSKIHFIFSAPAHATIQKQTYV